MGKPIVYIAGRMTGLPEFNFPAFNEAAKVLRSLGFEVRNPAENPFGDEYRYEDYLIMDMRSILDSDAIVVLPEYWKSKGATFECVVAATLGKPILNYETLMPISHWRRFRHRAERYRIRGGK